MNNQKKLAVAVKNFVDKVFLPNLKRTDPQLAQWNKFNQYLNSEYINYEQLYHYVESISINPTPSNTFEKRQLPFKKRNEEGGFHRGGQESGGGSFNPSKTFGGQRARMMFMKQDMDDFGDKNTGNFGSTRSFQNSSQTILPGLEKMCKMFMENHQRIQNILGGGSHHVTSPTKYG